MCPPATCEVACALNPTLDSALGAFAAQGRSAQAIAGRNASTVPWSNLLGRPPAGSGGMAISNAVPKQVELPGQALLAEPLLESAGDGACDGNGRSGGNRAIGCRQTVFVSIFAPVLRIHPLLLRTHDAQKNDDATDEDQQEYTPQSNFLNRECLSLRRQSTSSDLENLARMSVTSRRPLAASLTVSERAHIVRLETVTVSN